MSNIYSILFLLIQFFSMISSTKSENEFNFYTKSQKEKLNASCEKDPIFCSMMLIIEDIFYQIEAEEITIQNNNCNNLCLLYNNIRVRDMICEDLNTIYNSSSDIAKSEIIFENCVVLLSGEIGYENKDYKSIMFGQFLSELNFNSLVFNHTQNFRRIDLNFENSSKMYNYDDSGAIFQSWNADLRDQMDGILNKTYYEFIIKLKEKLNPFLNRKKIFSETEKQLLEKYSIFPGPSLFDERKNVTYLSYTIITNISKEEIIIKDKIFFHNLLVNFEYALNNNVTYNAGGFILKDVCFEADEHKENNYYDVNVTEMLKSADFNSLNNSLEIWEFIVDDFKKKFNENKIQKDTNARNMRFFY